ncbi:MAG: hypothetical protein IJI24_04765 [Lachnospiraceae bacterium]|nr:hypothetical protein [Lachnospiraceae bacterium]
MVKRYSFLAVFLFILDIALGIYLTSQYLMPSVTTKHRLDTMSVAEWIGAEIPSGTDAFTLKQGENPTGDFLSVTGADASSSLIQHNDPASNVPEKAVDGDLSTSWQEDGEDGPGIGEWICYSFGEGTRVESIVMHLGVWSEANGTVYYYLDNRPKTLLIDAGDRHFSVEIPDEKQAWTIVFDEPLQEDAIIFTIADVYAGSSYDDTGISELAFYGRNG